MDNKPHEQGHGKGLEELLKGAPKSEHAQDEHGDKKESPPTGLVHYLSSALKNLVTLPMNIYDKVIYEIGGSIGSIFSYSGKSHDSPKKAEHHEEAHA